MQHTNTGYITRCRTKRSKAGNMMTSFRLFPDGPTYYIAMHRDIGNHHILSDGQYVTVSGDLIDKTQGTVFVRSVRIAGVEVTPARKEAVPCLTCKGLGFHILPNGDIALPCETCGRYPKEDWL